MGALLINQLFQQNLQEEADHLLRGSILRGATTKRPPGLITIIDSVNSDEGLPPGLEFPVGSFQTTRLEIISSEPDALLRTSIIKIGFHKLDIDIRVTQPPDALRGFTIVAGNDHPAHVIQEIVSEGHLTLHAGYRQNIGQHRLLLNFVVLQDFVYCTGGFYAFGELTDELSQR